MNVMRRYLIGGIFTSLLLVFATFTLFSISEVNAEGIISVNADGYENTILVEFENESTSKIKTIRMWPGGEVTFESFKSEPGWGGGKYSDGKLVIFTATNTLNPNESVKFGLITSKIVNGINWKALDQNGNDIDTGKTSIQTISETDYIFTEEESKEVIEAKETGNQLYGTKKFIPDVIRVGSDVRLVGNGFDLQENLKLYLDNTIIKEVNTDDQGNFLTTIEIPNTKDAGTSEFIIKDESGNIQSTSIEVKAAENRFLKTAKFEISSIPAEIRYDETLTISGSAYPQSAVIIAFEDMDRVLEKVRVVTTNSNGEWVFEEIIDRGENIGEKYVIIKNNNNKTTKNLNVKSDYLVQAATAAVRYDQGETLSITGTGEPNQKTTVWIKDESGKIVHYDVFTSQPNGNLDYSFTTTNSFETGTYTAILKQSTGSDATVFGIGKYPTTTIVTLMEKTNFLLNSKAILNIIGPPTSKLNIQILDSNDQIELTDSLVTSSTGKMKYTIDLDGLTSGIYRAVVSSLSIQDSIKFSIGLEPGSGSISLISIQETYSPGQSILVLGNTGSNARITITLYDPSRNISSITETFSDDTGNFSTTAIGIPLDGELGTWEIVAHSRLDTKSIDINVTVPTQKGITLDMTDTEFNPGNTIMITGVAQSDASRLTIVITDQNGEIFSLLETPVTAYGTFSLPWLIPGSTETGTYTITVSDTENSASIDVFIQ
jgi:hypothetical protein